MFVTDLDKIPEDLRSEFVESEKDGVKGFQDKDSVELKQHFLNAKKDKTDYSEKNAALMAQLSEIESEKAAEIERVKQEAYEEALKKGDTEAVAARYAEQMADLEKRKDAEIGTYKQQLDSLVNTTKQANIDAVVNELSSLARDGKDRALFKKLIRSQVDYDATTGKTIFLDESGGATSLDLAGFKDSILKSGDYDSLLQAQFTTTGGGNVNGGGGGGAVQKKPKQMSEKERLLFKQQDPAGFRQAFNL